MDSENEVKNNAMHPFEFLGSGPSSMTSGQKSSAQLPETSATSYAAFSDVESTPQFHPVSTSENEARNKHIVQGLYIGLFAILGTFLRVVLAQVFGEYCKNPDTIGWLAASAPLCVTNGGATEQGGVIFADLPANMFGSFIMGCFQSGAALGLALPLAVAWLKPDDSFQDMPILHKAITTGFCGSLTTFSGWNSAMVVLLFGTGDNRPTHVFNAIFGYIIGMETAMGSFVAGRSLARRLHQMVNPILATEAEAAKARAAEGVYINQKLPDFERRYLPNLDMGDKGEKHYGEFLPMGRLDDLEKWRVSTKEARRVNHPHLPLLNRIEESVIVYGLSVPSDSVSMAKANGWDLEALESWCLSRSGRPDRLPSLGSASTLAITGDFYSKWFQPMYASVILGVVMGTLLALLFTLNGRHSYTITNRTVVYSMLWAPPGALLRWKLSELNGKCTVRGWDWFPIGTFAANFIGSIVSIVAIGGEYYMGSIYNVTHFWGVGSIRACKVGFAGSLTTVSTFVSEIHAFMQTSDHAYPYIFTTLFSCSAIASLFYGGLLFLRA